MTNARRALLAGTAVVAAACLVVPPPQPARAFWRIWQQLPPPPPPPTPVLVPRLKEVRDSGCGRADAVTVFGENAFMRREADRKTLAESAARAIAGAYIAETPEAARAILEPLLADTDENVSGAARLSVAFVLLRRRPASAVVSEVAALLAEPMPATLEADRHYLRAALAESAGNWRLVADEARQALATAPKYYNAQLLLALSQLHDIEEEGTLDRTCTSAMDRIEGVLLPLLRLGACPMHVGHFDLAAERHLKATGSHGEKLRLIRRTILSYVSRNDKLGASLVVEYRQRFGSDACLKRLDQLNFSGQGAAAPGATE